MSSLEHNRSGGCAGGSGRSQAVAAQQASRGAASEAEQLRRRAQQRPAKWESQPEQSRGDIGRRRGLEGAGRRLRVSAGEDQGNRVIQTGSRAIDFGRVRWGHDQCELGRSSRSGDRLGGCSGGKGRDGERWGGRGGAAGSLDGAVQCGQAGRSGVSEAVLGACDRGGSGGADGCDGVARRREAVTERGPGRANHRGRGGGAAA
mmetsp:Transcript_7822/g.30871  ORF Transcript_7822/g.30871 Transcript_7822/m.30871 type:complete len:204 (+) Transcript_7822:272-883(+)